MNIQQSQLVVRNETAKAVQPEQMNATAAHANAATAHLQAQTAAKPTAEDVSKSVQDMQKQLEEMRDTQVSIQFDNDIDRVIIKFTKTDGELIKQIPSKDFVEFQREFVKMTGLLLDTKA